MIRSPATLRWFVAALCLALLVLRVSGIHLHLCLDGSEPPTSYHMADSGIHHQDEHDAGESHSDRDLAVPDDVLVKKSPQAQDGAFLLMALALLLFLVIPERRGRFPDVDPARRIHHFSWLRPPLRGPPSPA